MLICQYNCRYIPHRHTELNDSYLAFIVFTAGRHFANNHNDADE